MNVIEQSDLARRWIDDPLITMRESELTAMVQDYGDAREDMGRYRHYGVRCDGVTRSMYAGRFAEAMTLAYSRFQAIRRGGK